MARVRKKGGEGRRKEREFQIASLLEFPYDKNAIKPWWDWLYVLIAMPIIVNG